MSRVPAFIIARTRELTISETACSANGHLVSEFRQPLSHKLLSGPCCCLPGALSPGVRGRGGHSSAQAPPHGHLGVMVGVAWIDLLVEQLLGHPLARDPHPPPQRTDSWRQSRGPSSLVESLGFIRSEVAGPWWACAGKVECLLCFKESPWAGVWRAGWRGQRAACPSSAKAGPLYDTRPPTAAPSKTGQWLLLGHCFQQRAGGSQRPPVWGRGPWLRRLLIPFSKGSGRGSWAGPPRGSGQVSPHFRLWAGE